MKKRKIIILLILTTLINSCSNRLGESKDYFVVPTHDDTLKGEELSEYIHSKTPVYIFTTPLGLVCAANLSNGTIQLLDTTNGQIIYSRLNNGKGPDELLSPLGMGFNTTLLSFAVLESAKEQLINYTVSDTGIKQLNTFQYKNINISSARIINDSTAVVLTSMPSQSLQLMNDNGEIKDRIPYQILDKEGLNYDKYYYPSVIDVSLKNKKIVAADLFLPSVMIYSYEQNKLKLLLKKMVITPYYSFKNGWRWVIPDKHRGGFMNLAVTDNFIYLTYYGITSGEWDKHVFENFNEITLLVLDYQGNLVKSYLLDHNILSFAVTPDDRELYGMVERPDLLLVKYKLK